mmetsp:Transcript_832/g.1107  ORF Transcript_832/g.1107 Transcript_832/m.1107 type:complete len:90 (+) Transcript_832:209-478(+)|eukprot:CAMPEP_0198137938 /NCGR_PEP_ID=MMETSP1443-20131203/1363_1 /TAXON_ID=186043 /ORGANISM="Entomoneis sp., Strain CCMP2396" /LENGTH=89 /DNA_ID=CAMNT_0043799519 /DNA_START=129 /DNA_END=398 /DNA_ORIENTATION=+
MTKKEEEQDVVVPMAVEPIASAEPTAYAEPSSKMDEQGGPPIPAGHARFYCSKCHTPYDLPNQATSWRCASCHTFNSTTMGECEWCTVL